MTKVKIMLLSLTLLAVVGGALAYKGENGDTFCTAEAYFTLVKGYYCIFSNHLGTITTTKDCDFKTPAVTTTNVGDLKVCTTLALFNGNCPVDCPMTTSIVPN